MGSPIKAVTLDFDGTLVDSWADERAATVGTARDLIGIDSDERMDRLWQSYRAVHVRVWAPVLASPPPTDPEAWDPRRILTNIWRETLHDAGITSDQPVEGMVEHWLALYCGTPTAFADVDGVIGRLRGDHKLAIITNGTLATQHPRIERSGYYPLVDHVAIAGERGFGKPRPEIFESTLSCLGVGPGEAVHVGDSLYADIGGAKAAGMKAVWMNRTGAAPAAGSAVPDAVVNSMEELPRALASL